MNTSGLGLLRLLSNNQFAKEIGKEIKTMDTDSWYWIK
jgi:hypothetical protein